MSHDEIVFPMIERREFLKAFNMIMAQKGVVERQAKEVADYDEDLDVGYKRLARGRARCWRSRSPRSVPVAAKRRSRVDTGSSPSEARLSQSGTGGAVIVEGARR